MEKSKPVIKVIDEPYFWILIAFFTILIFISPNNSDILLPIGISFITAYYFLSFNTNCPRCNKPFAKKRVSQERIGQAYESSDRDLDLTSSTYSTRIKHYKCKYCKYEWDDEKEFRSKN
ncbi:hypothetical protein C0585_03620 [Candidatus Woesearchaeota archaeon]|nr:MAG: hypothetical protein C0585_03620 [Candidatus Woesearchaeota archaeon]